MEVTCKLGTLSCEGVQETVENELEPGTKEKVTLTNWLHPKSGFGVVAGHWIIDRSGPQANRLLATLDIKIVDLGDNAATQSPK